MAAVEFFFDCSSPWTYLGFENIIRAAAEDGFDIDWKPILVGGVFNDANPSVYQRRDNPVPSKEAYQAKDLKDWADYTGLTIVWQPTVFPVNSVKAMRGCIAAGRQGKMIEHARTVFEAYWSEDQDISQEDVLGDICDRVGLDRDDYFAALADPVIKDQLKANTAALVERGGFGSPTYFVGGTDMYFGNDRLPLIREAVRRLG